ncbi:uncharacterized protein BJX67DRAFT_286994 [Aspergillus lucknowensis]|uniref:Uncharacterized protein n=1 Tax=Aspergillus lucknowensis TaxID=176173 RepID=A0ABR4M2Y3_9EURO
MAVRLPRAPWCLAFHDLWCPKNPGSDRGDCSMGLSFWGKPGRPPHKAPVVKADGKYFDSLSPQSSSVEDGRRGAISHSSSSNLPSRLGHSCCANLPFPSQTAFKKSLWNFHGDQSSNADSSSLADDIKALLRSLGLDRANLCFGCLLGFGAPWRPKNTTFS